jgi:hypothetical protein
MGLLIVPLPIEIGPEFGALKPASLTREQRIEIPLLKEAANWGRPLYLRSGKTS